NYISSIGCAVSEDGVHFQRYKRPVLEPTDEFDRFGCEDPRVTYLQFDERGLFLITYTALSAPAFSGRGNRVGLASTEDFRAFQKHGLVTPGVEDKDAVIFPGLINGRIAMLHRILPDIQIVYFDDFEQMTNPGEDFWGKYLATLSDFTVMKPKYEWEARKIGAGPPPIETEEGWLLLYHGVDEKGVYRMGAALLDLENPIRVRARSPQPLLEPQKPYERDGDIPNVVFPEGAVILNENLYVYYGGADKCCCLATVKLKDLLDYLLGL
ncbi:MAG: glycosidase, partial [Chloroflexi bacterium]